jgi:hypothetical protein
VRYLEGVKIMGNTTRPPAWQELEELRTCLWSVPFYASIMFVIHILDNHVNGLWLFYEWWPWIEFSIAFGIVGGIGLRLWQLWQRRQQWR